MVKRLRWNAAFRLFNEEFITISLASLIKVYAFDLSNFFESFSSFFALLLLTSTILTPFFVTKWLWKMHAKGFDRLLDEKHRQKWGSLTLDLYVRDKMALLFTLVFMVRRLVLAFIIVGLSRWSFFQVQVITNLNCFTLIY